MSNRTQKLPAYARISKVQYDKHNEEQDERSIEYAVRRRIGREWSSFWSQKGLLQQYRICFVEEGVNNCASSVQPLFVARELMAFLPGAENRSQI